MHILRKMAIDAMHPLLDMDIHQVDRHTVHMDALRGRQLLKSHGGHQVLGPWVGNDIARMVEQVPLAVLAKHSAKRPAVSMKVAELRMFCFGIQFREMIEKLRIGEVVMGGRFVRVGHLHRANSSALGYFCLAG